MRGQAVPSAILYKMLYKEYASHSLIQGLVLLSEQL